VSPWRNREKREREGRENPRQAHQSNMHGAWNVTVNCETVLAVDDE